MISAGDIVFDRQAIFFDHRFEKPKAS